MAELVDALLSGSSAARRGGSSPLQGTIICFTLNWLRSPLRGRAPRGAASSRPYLTSFGFEFGPTLGGICFPVRARRTANGNRFGDIFRLKKRLNSFKLPKVSVVFKPVLLDFCLTKIEGGPQSTCSLNAAAAANGAKASAPIASAHKNKKGWLNKVPPSARRLAEPAPKMTVGA